MTRPAKYPDGVCMVRTPGSRAKHVISCSCPGCTSTVEVTVKDERVPLVALHKMVIQKGWAKRHGRYTCPEHPK